MKQCQKCGKELFDEAVICPGCGSKQTAPAPDARTDEKVNVDYGEAVSSSITTNIISVVIIAAAAAIAWFMSCFSGAIMFLAAELVALIPSTSFNRMFKMNCGISDKREMKAAAKEESKRLKSKYPSFKFSKIIAIAALVMLIAAFAVPEIAGVKFFVR